MKGLFKLIVVFIAVGCFVSSAAAQKVKGNFKIKKDSVIIITPNIEIKKVVGRNYFDGIEFVEAPKERRQISNLVLKTIKEIFPKSRYGHIPFMLEDAGTINAALERGPNPKPEIAPKEVLISSSQRSIFFSSNNYFGDDNSIFMIFYIIDNENGSWKMVKRKKYEFSPLKTKKFVKVLSKELKRLK